MVRKGIVLGAVTGVIAIVGALTASVKVEASSVPAAPRKKAQVEAAPPPSRPLRLLFVHHSVGLQLLSEPGPNGEPGKHENGGGLRKLLEGAGYQVHTATYGSELGEKTDIFDWPEKFSSQLPRLLTTADGTKPLPVGQRHDVVLFKSCFPNSGFVGRGSAPGSSSGPELTLENARAVFNGLLPQFSQHPETLFVYLTAPPMAGGYREPAWKWLAKSVLGRGGTEHLSQQAALAREFNDWVAGSDGWLRDYAAKNVAVIDYYDLLTDNGVSNFLRYPSGDGFDSHPSSAGQSKAAPQVLAALNRAVQRWSRVNEQPGAGLTAGTQ